MVLFKYNFYVFYSNNQFILLWDVENTDKERIKMKLLQILLLSPYNINNFVYFFYVFFCVCNYDFFCKCINIFTSLYLLSHCPENFYTIFSYLYIHF